MRREKAGCVTWRSWAERLKLRVSARLTKSSSHLVSIRRLCEAATYWVNRHRPAIAMNASDLLALDATRLSRADRPARAVLPRADGRHAGAHRGPQPALQRHRLAARRRSSCSTRPASATRSSRAASASAGCTAFRGGQGPEPCGRSPRPRWDRRSRRGRRRAATAFMWPACAAPARSSSARPTRPSSGSARTPTTRSSAPRSMPTIPR